MVRKKKEVMRPVVAKPLNDTDKRNLVTSFVTNTVNESVINKVDNNDTNIVTESEQKDVTDNITENDINIITNKVTNFVTNDDTDSIAINDTNIVTSNVTNKDTTLVTDNETNKVTKEDTKIVTKRVAKNVTIIKSITLGKKDIIAKFTSDKRVRPNYNLSQDTVEKIEKISEILGYKKAEFVDIYLNGTLEKVLKDLEKNK